MATYNTINNQQRHVPNLRQTSHHCPRARHHHLTILRPSTLWSVLHHIVLVSSLPDRSCKTRSVASHNVSAVAAIGICLWTDSINPLNSWVCRTNKLNMETRWDLYLEPEVLVRETILAQFLRTQKQQFVVRKSPPWVIVTISELLGRGKEEQKWPTLSLLHT